jgi:predicted DNA-binding transcriptional regulator AlpA
MATKTCPPSEESVNRADRAGDLLTAHGFFDGLGQLIAEAPREELPALVVQLAARLAQLGAALAVPATKAGPMEDAPDRNISAREAAKRLGVSLPYLYKHAGTYPFALRIGRRIVFSARGLAVWNRRQMNGDAA